MAGTVADAVATFGASVKPKLASAVIDGAPEDQLRGPLETLVQALGELGGLPKGIVHLIGETTLRHLKTRPDFAVTVHGPLIGFIEVKAPGKGADPRKFGDPHDKDQWAKLKALPNLMYTDGNSFSLWQDGVLQGTVVHLDGDVETSGSKLKAPATLMPLVSAFLTWHPFPPSSAKKLAEVSARLCRLLRDEVVEQMELGSEGLTALAKDWRTLLFPEADDTAFADGYAQAVTFGLLVARARGISLKDGIDHAAQELRKTNSLIGTALRLLTDDAANQDSLKTSIGTLTRVLESVDWPTITKEKPDAWLYFYEDFLEVYDNKLRKRTGSYYTPPEVVSAMVRLVDEVLRGPLFDRPTGLAAPDVTIADPAVGTGTFLLGVLRKIAETVEEDQGKGAVRGAIEASAKRLIGFELQFGPFAVAQLRLIAEMQALMTIPGQPVPTSPELQLFITDTLGNPFIEDDHFSSMVAAIATSRRNANRIKKNETITVVIGNPPYKEKAEGRGGWIEAGSTDASDALRPPLERWQPPAAWGVGAHTKHLRNLYIYFWRWATWKVFGSGYGASTGLPETDKAGIVCFITVAGFLNGPGFQRMRDDLRRTCSEIWVVDCSPDGHQPEVKTRIFQGVQQPVCIVLAARKIGKMADAPAKVRFHALPKGRREEKFAALAELSIEGSAWLDCSSIGRDPFLPKASGAWADFPLFKDLFLYNGSGVQPGRTWVISPDAASLETRWVKLVRETSPVLKEKLFHPHLRDGLPGDKHIRKDVSNILPGHHRSGNTIINETGDIVGVTRYAFRSFNRQWIIPDARLINQLNPILWEWHSDNQVYITALHRASPTSGPAVTLCGDIPDYDHYKGSFGGRVHPLWTARSREKSNVRAALLLCLAESFGYDVGPEHVMAYLAALMAHPAFTARFAPDLIQPGLRVPLTADAALFAEAVTIGREVVWLHCYGERFADPAAGRPKKAPRLTKDEAPRIPAEGAIPTAPEPLPETMDYDPATQRLRIGKGYVENVTPAMWAYEVSGKHVLRQWFSYRRRDRTRPMIGDRRPPSPLETIQPEGWLAEYTSDLLDLLNVLGRLIKLEPAQADLLTRICAGPLLSAETLRAAGAIVPRPGSEAV